MTDQSSCDQLKEENEAYWTNRASGYSEVNKDELRTQQKATWTAELAAQIESAFPGAQPHELHVLDMGCGSGILSVAGLLLGADSAVGVDIDALAVKTAVANAEINHVGDKFTGICGNLADKVTGTFDVVVANIVADVVILLTKDAPRFMKPDTVYIMSGIIDTREDDVLACLADKFEIIDRKEEKGWVA